LENTYNILIQKLDRFIRKFYKNQLIKGAIYTLSLLIFFFLLATLLEYFGRFNVSTRTVIFYLYIFINIIILGKYIAIPLLKLYRFGKIISHEQAAIIIGKHFSDVDDKLLNTLQLKKLSNESEWDTSLLLAGIEQKVTELKSVPFHSAINFTVNKRYLKYLMIPAIILIGMLISVPKVITEPSKRLVNYTEDFVKPLPYTITVENEDLTAIENEDFVLSVKLSGEEIPDKVYLNSDNILKKLNKKSPVHFEYRFTNLKKNVLFNLQTADFQMNEMTLTVLPKPMILDFSIELDYPAYTAKKDETVYNIGDVVFPEGTNVSWNFRTRNSKNIQFLSEDSSFYIDNTSNERFQYKLKPQKSTPYAIVASNQFISNHDTLFYSLNLIPDQFPVIVSQDYQDSVFKTRLYFTGVVKDDYGLSMLTFNVDYKNEHLVDTIPLLRSLTSQQFMHYYEVPVQLVKPGEQISYFFEVWDNDAVNGRKSSRTQMNTLTLPSQEQIEKETEDSNENIKEELTEAIDETKKIQEEIDKLNKKLVSQEELSWQDKEQIKDLINQHKELENRIDKIIEENKEKSLKENQFKQQDEELVRKQQKLNELIEKLKENDEIRELLEELEKLMEEASKEQVKEMLDEMEMSNEEMEKMLDQNLELFKQFEFEQKLDETINKLEDLAKDQNELSEKTESKEINEEKSLAEQEKIDEEFDQIQDDLEKLDEMNEALEDSNNFDKMEEKQEDVETEMENAMEQLKDGKQKKGSHSQKNAAQKMQEMQQAMSDMQMDMVQEGMAEDMDSLRDILENLLQLSFDQETLIDKVAEVNINDPIYTDLIQEQYKIKDDIKVVEDSLFALSKRQIMIQPFVQKEIASIKKNMTSAIDNLKERRTANATGRQQYIMTSLNNLALMLSETLNQMMQAMQMQSSSSCKNSGMPKPGQGQGKMKSLRQMQEQLNRQIQNMKGKQQGEKQKPGGEQQGGQGMNEKLARSAAQQQYIRNELGKMADQLEKDGDLNSGKELKRIMEEMNKTETDLVNKMLSKETLNRQKNILTRLLESEKAMMERDKEEKREAKESGLENLRNPEKLFKYKQLPTNEVELMKRVQPSFKLFYKHKVNEYFFNFEELLEQ